MGSLEDTELLTREARAAGAVINTASADHAGSVQALIDGLKGSANPLLHNSGSSVNGHDARGTRRSHSVFDEERLTPGFEARYVRAARIACQAFQQLAGARYGVRWLESDRLHDLPLPRTRLGDELRDLFPGTRELAPKEHPFPAAHVLRSMGMLVEPFIYMNAVLQDFLLAGGRVVVREFVAAEEVMALAEPVVVNCTGLGAKALFGDDELIPIKGQLCVLVPQPEVDYVVSTADGLYMMPRQDGMVLGGTHERGVWDLAVSQAATERILAGNARRFGPA
jgi:hypothetical protein